MLKGLHLTVMIGPVIPIPVPQVVTDAMHLRSTSKTAKTSPPLQYQFSTGQDARRCKPCSC